MYYKFPVPRAVKAIFKKLGYYNLVQYAPYTFKCNILNIEPLYDRRKCASALFVFDTLTGKVDSPHILSLLNISVPARFLRSNQSIFISVRGHRTNYFTTCLTLASLGLVTETVFVEPYFKMVLKLQVTIDLVNVNLDISTYILSMIS